MKDFAESRCDSLALSAVWVRRLKRRSQPSAEISAIPFDEPITFSKANETLWVFCLFTVNGCLFSPPLPRHGPAHTLRWRVSSSGLPRSFYSVRFSSFDDEEVASSSCRSYLLFFSFFAPLFLRSLTPNPFEDRAHYAWTTLLVAASRKWARATWFCDCRGSFWTKFHYPCRWSFWLGFF